MENTKNQRLSTDDLQKMGQLLHQLELLSLSTGMSTRELCNLLADTSEGK